MRHNKFGLLALATVVLGCTGATAFAQDAGAPPPPAQGGRGGGRQGGGRQFGGGPVQLSTLSLSTMDYGLKLTADQKTQIQTLLTQHDKDVKALPAAPAFTPGQPPSQDDIQAMRDSMQKRRELNTKSDDAIKALLTDDQKKMLPDFVKELQGMQQSGIPVAILGDLKLTADQKTKITAQAEKNQTAMQQKMQDARQSGQRMSPQDRMAMMKDAQDKVTELLTPTQRAMVEKYNRDHPNQGFGGPGGGRQRGGGAGAANPPGGV
jgi:Spy/CpxP family protein refolding chaperone